MECACELQATAWLAEKQAREYVQGLEIRIKHGAAIEDCEFDFDHELQMVRHRTQPVTSAQPEPPREDVG